MSGSTTPPETSGRPPWLRKSLRGIELVELTVGGVLLAGILALVMLQVLARVTSLPGTVWTGELARFALVWVTFALSGYLLGRDEHIALDVLDRVLPDLGRRILRVFSLLVVLATCLVFGYEGLTLVTAGSPIKSPAAGIPQAWVYVIPTVGMLLTALRAIVGILFPLEESNVVHVAGEAIVVEDIHPVAVPTHEGGRA